MVLSVRFLTNVGSVNDFAYGDGFVEFTEGEAPELYFQLIDTNKDTAAEGYKPAGRRYMPAAGSTLSVQIENINDAKKITRFATQPFATDPSIWKLQIFSTDLIRGTATIRLTLTEGVKISYGKLQAALRVQTRTGV